MSKKEWWTCYFLYRVRPVLWCVGVMLAVHICNTLQPLHAAWEWLIFGTLFSAIAIIGSCIWANPRHDRRYLYWRWARHGYTGQPQVSAEQYLDGLAADRKRVTDEKEREENKRHMIEARVKAECEYFSIHDEFSVTNYMRKELLKRGIR